MHFIQVGKVSRCTGTQSNLFVSLHYELGALTAAMSRTGQINSVAVY